MHNSVLAIIVTYNRKNLLKESIEALLGQTIKGVDILIVDNFSTDGTNEYIGNYIKEKKVFYVNTGKNIGGAGGFAFGINWGVKNGYDYLWLMDDDTIPEADALEHLLDTKDNLQDKFGFLCSYAKWVDGTACEMNVPRISELWRSSINLLEQSVIRLDSASFVSFFVRTEVVKKVGLPISEFFIWADDLEYSLRISKLYPCYFVYKSQVIHKMKSNSDTKIAYSEKERLERYKYLFRNRFYIAKKSGKDEIFHFVKYAYNNIKSIIRHSNGYKIYKCYIVISSFLKGVFFNPSIRYPEVHNNER